MKRTIAAVALLVASCGGSTPDSIVGSVIAIDGTLQQTASFTLIADGTRYEFTPADGLTFHGGPLSHLSDHVRSGVRVEVQFEERDGELVATYVGDATLGG